MFKGLRKSLAILLLTLLGLLLYGGYLMQKHPELLLNSHSVRWASDHVLRPMGVELRFGSLDLSFDRKNFWQRSLRIQAQNFSLRFEDFDLILPSLDGLVWVNLHPKRLAIDEIGPLQVKGMQLQMKSPATAPASIEEELKPESSEKLPQAFWQNIRWQGPLSVESSYIHWQAGDSSWTGGRILLELATAEDQKFTLRLLAQEQTAQLDGLRMVLPQLEAESAFRWNGQELTPLRIGPISTRGLELAIKATPSKKDETPIDWQKWLQRLEKLEVAPIKLDIAQLRYQESPEQSYQAALSLDLLRSSSTDWQLQFKGSQIKGLPVHELAFDLKASLPEQNFARWKSSWKGTLRLSEGGQASLQGDLAKEADRYQTSISAQVKQGEQRALVEAKAQTHGSRFGVELSAEVQKPVSALASAKISQCRWQGEWSGEPLEAILSQLGCSLRLERSLLSEESQFPLELPRSQEIQLKGPIRLSQLASKAPQITADLEAQMPAWKKGAIRAEGQVKAKLQGPLKGFMQQAQIHIEGGTKLSIESFQALVAQLRHSSWEVPAPFHTLEGPVSCEATARLDLHKQRYEVPLHCQSSLASGSQAFRWTAKGQLSSRSQAKPLLSLEVHLDQIALELPKLVIGEPLPQLLADKRLSPLADVTPDAKQSPIDWDILIHTPSESPVRLISHLMKEPVPIAIELHASSETKAVTGQLTVQRYRLDLMKKKALIENLGVRLLAEEASPQLFGLVRFEDADTKIDLKLAGTIDRPFYVLESQPPRPPTELLSMILFGGKPDAMSDDNLRSVEQTRAAMIDGAIGLVSMFYLASTPIDSVGYNPYTGVFRARVQLGQGTSLFVGSDLEGAKQSIGLRRRLTENWSFETGAETSEADGKNKGLAMFKWGRRY